MAAVIVVGGGGFLFGQRAAKDQVPAPTPAPLATPVPTATPAEPPSRTLDRAALIALASIAADATAQGAARPPELDEAVGKRFSIALPFGCGGPAGESSNAPMRWRYDEEAEALRFHVAPVALAPTDWWPEAARSDIEAIEGFWIARPWTLSESCPSGGDTGAPNATDPVTLPGQTLAIGQFFAAGGARQRRRDGRPYTAVVRVATEAFRPEQGFRVQLTGHIAAVPGGGATACRQPGGPEQRPICLIATTLDKVTIENPVSGESLVTWAVAGARQSE
ncbi:hypothetical protein [Sphingomonas soli]|uniref:hypothetical protein n=1 Tax=Sphingomonas soli TaxID=266127 RepID=UPI0012EDA726|nr:hypothetical protein [Sphingomonas soli]